MGFIFKSREERIVEIERLINERPELLKTELKLLLQEYDQLLTTIEQLNKIINSHDASHYVAKNRKTLLSTVFGRVYDAIKVCERERKLGENPQHKRFAELVKELAGRLKEYRSYLLSGVIRSKDDATSVFTRSILGHVKQALLELKQEIEKEKLRANNVAKSVSKA
jgi:hypothetical protein